MKSTNLALVPTEARSSSMKDRLLDAMSGSFKRLFTEAPDASPHSPAVPLRRMAHTASRFTT